jgi:hypothetical protein
MPASNDIDRQFIRAPLTAEMELGSFVAAHHATPTALTLYDRPRTRGLFRGNSHQRVEL